MTLLYPKADTATQWYAPHWPGTTPMHTNVFLLHSTEGGDWPTYDRGQGPGEVAPNATYKRTARTIRQHFPADMSSRALVNLPGGVETNTLNVFQLEIVGTCDPTMKGKLHDAQGRQAPYVPELDDDGIDDIAHLWLWLNQATDVPLTALPASRWKAYPGSYGTGNGTRMTGAQWSAFTGVCGHQHAPENVHGDPGAFPIARLLARVKELAGGEPPKDPPAGQPSMQALHDDIVAARATALQLRAAHPKWGPRTLTPVSKSLESAAGHLNDFLDGDPNT